MGNEVNGIKLLITTYYPTKIRLTLALYFCLILSSVELKGLKPDAKVFCSSSSRHSPALSTIENKCTGNTHTSF
jgi:hypothetical protein